MPHEENCTGDILGEGMLKKNLSIYLTRFFNYIYINVVIQWEIFFEKSSNPFVNIRIFFSQNNTFFLIPCHYLLTS